MRFYHVQIAAGRDEAYCSIDVLTPVCKSVEPEAIAAEPVRVVIDRFDEVRRRQPGVDLVQFQHLEIGEIEWKGYAGKQDSLKDTLGDSEYVGCSNVEAIGEV